MYSERRKERKENQLSTYTNWPCAKRQRAKSASARARARQRRQVLRRLRDGAHVRPAPLHAVCGEAGRVRSRHRRVQMHRRVHLARQPTAAQLARLRLFHRAVLRARRGDASAPGGGSARESRPPARACVTKMTSRQATTAHQRWATSATAAARERGGWRRRSRRRARRQDETQRGGVMRLPGLLAQALQHGWRAVGARLPGEGGEVQAPQLLQRQQAQARSQRPQRQLRRHRRVRVVLLLLVRRRRRRQQVVVRAVRPSRAAGAQAAAAPLRPASLSQQMLRLALARSLRVRGARDGAGAGRRHCGGGGAGGPTAAPGAAQPQAARSLETPPRARASECARVRAAAARARGRCARESEARTGQTGRAPPATTFTALSRNASVFCCPDARPVLAVRRPARAAATSAARGARR